MIILTVVAYLLIIKKRNRDVRIFFLSN